MKSSLKLRFLLTALFTIGIGVWWLFSQVLLPLPVHVGADPQIAYMLSSLSPFKGEAYTFIDHPGTPVEILGTLILALTFPFMGADRASFIMAHIQNPSLFLIMARMLLVLGSVSTLVVLAKHILRKVHWTDELAACAVAVLFFAIYPRAFDQIVAWSHNSFSYPLAAMLGLGVILIFRDQRGGTKRGRIMLGALFGVLTAIQLYFFTWVLGAMVAALVFSLLDRDGMQAVEFIIQFGAASLGGFIIATLPIASRYGEFVRWIVQIGSHQGRHGSGPPGFISLSGAASNLQTLVYQAPLFFMAMVLTLLLLATALIRESSSWRSKQGLWACAAGFAAQLLVILILIIKHPGILYLQAAVVSLTLLLGVTLDLLRPDNASESGVFRLGVFGLSLLVFALFVFGELRAFLVHRAEAEQVNTAEAEISSFLEAYPSEQGVDEDALTQLWVYGMPSDCQALWYGNRYAHYVFTPEIGALCPHVLNYDLWEEVVTKPDGSLVPLTEVGWDLIVANEAAMLDFPELREVGEVIRSGVILGTFGRIVYIVNT
jgi:hypothetical protein